MVDAVVTTLIAQWSEGIIFIPQYRNNNIANEAAAQAQQVNFCWTLMKISLHFENPKDKATTPPFWCIQPFNIWGGNKLKIATYILVAAIILAGGPICFSTRINNDKQHYLKTPQREKRNYLTVISLDRNIIWRGCTTSTTSEARTVSELWGTKNSTVCDDNESTWLIYRSTMINKENRSSYQEERTDTNPTSRPIYHALSTEMIGNDFRMIVEVSGKRILHHGGREAKMQMRSTSSISVQENDWWRQIRRKLMSFTINLNCSSICDFSFMKNQRTSSFCAPPGRSHLLWRHRAHLCSSCN